MEIHNYIWIFSKKESVTIIKNKINKKKTKLNFIKRTNQYKIKLLCTNIINILKIKRKTNEIKMWKWKVLNTIDRNFIYGKRMLKTNHNLKRTTTGKILFNNSINEFL